MMMKRTFALVAAVALAVPSFAAEGWLTSMKEAQALSKKTGKPILADFTGSDWCAPCKLLHKEVFDTPQFKAWAKQNVVLLYLDFPIKKPLAPALTKQNDALAKKYQITGYPTVLFLKADGSRIGQTGYVPGGPTKWIPAAKAAMKAK